MELRNLQIIVRNKKILIVDLVPTLLTPRMAEFVCSGLQDVWSPYLRVFESEFECNFTLRFSKVSFIFIFAELKIR